MVANTGFSSAGAFGGFSVDDVESARRFYGEVLGIETSVNEMGILELHLASGARIIAYPKPDHTPATFTILNFAVDDIDAAVDELNARGVVTTIYNGTGAPVDDRGIMRGRGPDIAWFLDPAGNVLSVIRA